MKFNKVNETIDLWNSEPCPHIARGLTNDVDDSTLTAVRVIQGHIHKTKAAQPQPGINEVQGKQPHTLSLHSATAALEFGMRKGSL